MGDIKTCPICGYLIVGHLALSRKDNKTKICSDCGRKEAIEAFKDYLMKGGK